MTRFIPLPALALATVLTSPAMAMDAIAYVPSLWPSDTAFDVVSQDIVETPVFSIDEQVSVSEPVSPEIAER